MTQLKYAVSFVMWFFREINDTKLSIYAGSLVYITLLSLVPTLALSFSILHGLGVQNQIEPLLVEMLTPIGAHADQLVSNILEFVNNTNVQALGIIGVGMILYSGVSMVLKLEFAFNQIWGVKETRSIFRRVGYYLAMLMLGPVTLFLSIAFMGSVNDVAFIKPLLTLEYFFIPYYFFVNLASFLVIIFAVFFLYMVLPNHAVKAKPAFYAALIAALSWKISGLIFSGFIATSSNYNVIYSSFAVVILFIFWVYLTWLILLLGAMVCSKLQYHEYRYDQSLEQMPGEKIRFIRIALLLHVCRAFFVFQKPLAIVDLVEFVKLPVTDVSFMLDELEEKKLVILEKNKTGLFVFPSPKISDESLGHVLLYLDFPNDKLAGVNAEFEWDVLKAWYESGNSEHQSLMTLLVDHSSCEKKVDKNLFQRA